MRATRAYINLKNLEDNIEAIRKEIPESEILTVIKANAYGHGAVEIARALRRININYIGVAFPEEGAALRESGDLGEIVCIVPCRKDDVSILLNYNIQTAIFDIDILKYYSNYAIANGKVITAHLFINTGMNRDGIRWDKAVEFMELAKSHKGVKIIGLMTHYATSDFRERSFALGQLKDFNTAYEELKKAGFRFQFVHSANSGAIANLPESYYNMIRMGISVYGLMPEEELLDQIPLKPVLELKSEVLAIQEVKSGETVGYSFQYFARNDTRIAIVPIGYGDGYRRSLGNKAQCLINGKRYSVVGSVCMDQIFVEIFQDKIKVGDEVVLIGKQGNEFISVYELANFAGTIPYEITTGISSRVPRIIVD
ncbi:MAG: alanine racemase [bacterium]